MEIELLHLTGQMLKGKMQMIEPLSEYFDFMNQVVFI